MKPEQRIARYARGYKWLLTIFPGEKQGRFIDERAQLFVDRLRDRACEGGAIWRDALWMYGETIWAISGESMNVLMKKHQGILIAGGVTLALLMVPLIAMRYTDDVQWTGFDFLIAGAAIFAAGIGVNLFFSRSGNLAYKSAAAIALGATLMHFWANGAVGMVGPETDDFNALYHLVWIAGFVGAVAARLRPRGMARVLTGMGLAHAALGVIAFASGKPGQGLPGTVELIGVTGLFTSLFLLAAWLFSISEDASPTNGLKF